jgi:hypothetical protein
MKICCKNTAEFHRVVTTLPPDAYHLIILHDDACTPGACVCEPEYVIEGLTPETYERGQRAQAEWVRGHAN